ncbi:polysaccharide biosynthesis/export family protein [filamentous cyanobacterium LEGE 11480]|uniref:Polysaccharide biosynthesis/export family protein n=1 Tax=Romeriopsis navalis LEGE 11480 TaxID=2777977 RepID=A0A928Z3F1_9CYAN|nr:polysaccharide biosynthesis/export family protein [Romeriopsis navalis]MBE9029133.1 polysaccharide biosynthesis/export family protein [Romeriopsis navalis LEGE 11480]
MQLVFVPPRIRQITASSLTLLHTSASILTTVVVYQIASQPAVYAKGSEPLPIAPAQPFATTHTAPAQPLEPTTPLGQAQTPLPPNRPLETPRQRPTARELVEQARQRLRDRGELPPADVTVPTDTINSGTAAPSTLPAPPVIQPFNAYRLGPRDAIGIVVQRFADFNVQAALDPEGYITHPIIGKVRLQGLTIDQAQAKIQQQVDRFIINPVVLVSLITQRPIQVTLAGEIFEPGLYPLPQSPQLAAALLAGGGTREDADLRAVTLRRPMPDGTLRTEQFDIFNALKDGTALPNPSLQDGDTIYIPKLEVGDTSYDRTIASRSNLVRPQIIVRVLSYPSGGLRQVVLENGSTFLDALTNAGVNPDRADMRKIALIRFDDQKKKAVSVRLDGKKALMGDISQDVPLQDNDVIVIGRNLVGRITNVLNVFTQPFRDVLGFLLFFRQLGDSATDLFGPNR